MSWRLLAGVAGILLAGVCWSTSAHAVCEDPDGPRDTPEAQAADCDEDGWTPAQGDCDDFDETVFPGAPEICGDRKDNNCDGFIDEGCDSSWSRGALEGGAGCAGGSQAAPVGALILLFPLMLAGRRR